ncbi:MAG: hypothetical protein U1E31_02460 [Rickettsiales bacterium]
MTKLYNQNIIYYVYTIKEEENKKHYEAFTYKKFFSDLLAKSYYNFINYMNFNLKIYIAIIKS